MQLTHPATTCASTPGAATASPLSMPSLQPQLFCKVALLPLIFAFPNTSLEVAMFNLSGSSACNSLPACCSSRGNLANIRQERSLLRRALPLCTCKQWHPLSVRPHEPRGKLAGFPCFAINPGLTLETGETWGVWKTGVYHQTSGKNKKETTQ